MVQGLDDEIDVRVVNIITADNHKFELSEKILSQSGFFDALLKSDSEETTVNLSNIDGETFSKISEYLEYSVDKPPLEIKTIIGKEMEDIVGKYYSDYCSVDIPLLHKMINASNYLNIDPLLHLCCAKFATLIRGKTAEQVKRIINLS
jgi:S-phase kinase-associated protein 1